MKIGILTLLVIYFKRNVKHSTITGIYRHKMASDGLYARIYKFDQKILSQKIYLRHRFTPHDYLTILPIH